MEPVLHSETVPKVLGRKFPVRNWKFASISIVVLLGLTRLFTTSAISVVAEVFCVASVVVFAAAAVFGLATKLRA